MKKIWYFLYTLYTPAQILSRGGKKKKHTNHTNMTQNQAANLYKIISKSDTENNLWILQNICMMEQHQDTEIRVNSKVSGGKYFWKCVFILFKTFIYSCIFQNTKDQDMKKLFSPSYLYGHDAQSLIMRKDQTLHILYFEEKHGVKHLHLGMVRKVKF